MTSIRWRYYSREKTKPRPWTDARRAASLVSVPRMYEPAVFRGIVNAETRTDALDEAKRRVADDHLVVDVICEASWNTLTPTERAVFLGTFEPPQETDQTKIVNGVRLSVCRLCGGQISQQLDPAKRRHGRPKAFCDACLPERVRRWRQYEATQKAKARAGAARK